MISIEKVDNKSVCNFFKVSRIRKNVMYTENIKNKLFVLKFRLKLTAKHFLTYKISHNKQNVKIK